MSMQNCCVAQHERVVRISLTYKTIILLRRRGGEGRSFFKAAWFSSTPPLQALQEAVTIMGALGMHNFEIIYAT